MQQFEAIIDEHVSTWIHQAQECHASSTEAAPRLLTSFKYLAVDCVSHLTLGSPFGSLKSNSDVYRFIEVFNAGTRVQSCLSVIPELKRILVFLSHVPILGGYLAPEPGDGTSIGTVLAVSRGRTLLANGDVLTEEGHPETSQRAPNPAKRKRRDARLIYCPRHDGA